MLTVYSFHRQCYFNFVILFIRISQPDTELHHLKLKNDEIVCNVISKAYLTFEVNKYSIGRLLADRCEAPPTLHSHWTARLSVNTRLIMERHCGPGFSSQIYSPQCAEKRVR